METKICRYMFIFFFYSFILFFLGWRMSQSQQPSVRGKTQITHLSTRGSPKPNSFLTCFWNMEGNQTSWRKHGTSKLNTICMCRNFDFISDVLAVRQLHQPLYHCFMLYLRMYMKMTFILLHWFSNYGRRTTRGTWAPSKGMCGICFFFSVMALTTWRIHMRWRSFVALKPNCGVSFEI